MRQTPKTRRWCGYCHASALAVMMCLSFGLQACTVVSIEEDRMARAQQSDSFDARAYAEQVWAAKVVPAIDGRAQPVDTLLAALKTDAATTEKNFGRQAGEGSPFTYALKGEGTVTAVDASGPAGVATVRAGNTDVLIRTGPYVSGTTLRDSLAFISFNDFTNQLVYADVSKSLNEKALRANAAAIGALRVGQKVRFTGVFAHTADSAVRVTPVRLDVVS
ncbi:DUF2291 domain-containing protein [Asticcacaulis sp. BYS171W]|uniref:DUF2291 domain-containing protein n=1 Tax=Asticcacaulis aquaticus TaxID=2984212 RepID=A0ABT5HVQ5_9CAUL|nr:DUF2291 domain-containing protein [Asticcacaulis aquaticus]MDC7684160.1 DUF2291 domain-containing protein [Asticcacaulis aquaticus]